MPNKRRVLIVVVFIVAAVSIVATVAIIAAILFFASSGDTVSISETTAVGVPNGTATTKSIGTGGGTLASSDGRITVTVPPNAVTQTLEFKIQPITNLAGGGVGNAYRLEPSDQKFATPVEVAFNLEAQGLKNMAPETIAVAYQDKSGNWQAFKTVNVDQVKKTISVSTNHFTDFSMTTLILSPATAKLRLRQGIEIELKGCVVDNYNWYTRFRGLIGRPICKDILPSASRWSVDFGTITPAGPGQAVYQAPATKPPGNKAKVRFVFQLAHWGKTDQWEARESEITILTDEYKASGNFGPNTISGNICDLERPFTLETSNPLMPEFKFTPTSGTSGTWEYAYTGGVTGGGKGNYEVSGPEGQRTTIHFHGSATARAGGPSGTGSGGLNITLTPLAEGEQCSDK